MKETTTLVPRVRTWLLIECQECIECKHELGVLQQHYMHSTRAILNPQQLCRLRANFIHLWLCNPSCPTWTDAVKLR